MSGLPRHPRLRKACWRIPLILVLWLTGCTVGPLQCRPDLVLRPPSPRQTDPAAKGMAEMVGMVDAVMVTCEARY